MTTEPSSKESASELHCFKVDFMSVIMNHIGSSKAVIILRNEGSLPDLLTGPTAGAIIKAVAEEMKKLGYEKMCASMYKDMLTVEDCTHHISWETDFVFFNFTADELQMVASQLQRPHQKS
jgi:hypothetical protein